MTRMKKKRTAETFDKTCPEVMAIMDGIEAKRKKTPFNSASKLPRAKKK